MSVGDTAGDAGAEATPPESFIDRLRRENALATGGADAVGVPDASPHAHPADPVDRVDPDGSAVRSTTSSESPEEAGNEAEDTSAPEPTHRMPPEARRALVSLMRQGVVLAARKVKVFEALVRHEAPIRAHLAELYLQLVLDEPAGVAFIRNRPPGAADAEAGDAEGADDSGDDPDEALDDGADAGTLIARRTLPLYDTLLLLILRRHYQERQTAGEQRIVIDVERVESAFVPFLPLAASERRDRRQLNAALTRLVDKRLLSRVRGDDQRFEITPVIRYVVDAAFLDALLSEYERLAGGSGETADSPSSSDGASS